MLPGLSRIPEISLTSVIDILFVALVIYGFLKLLKWTHAMPALLGVALVTLAVYWAHFRGLNTIDWLVAAVAPLTIFALIVVFAAEIRHSLVRLGRNISTSRFSGRRVETYDDIVMAAALFSKNKTGALIVIERQDDLGNHIDSGVRLDAVLSYDLLATIFLHKTPLHDGAVIVQKDRIAAAACFLPLATDPQLSTQLGTRHRAGIGVTEETDAIAVIVSEETGGISIATSGVIERDLSPEHLRERISELLRRYIPRTTLPTAATDRDLANTEPTREPVAQEKGIADGAEL
ncbi:MAG TPA: diadenylate cyclase CdaA [Candidatus Eisenbacteria bacterium]|nr:diadenylate cyclase CdaA [Candidatus Eisenbacteria bacterium]